MLLSKIGSMNFSLLVKKTVRPLWLQYVESLYFDVYALLDPNAILSFVTSYVAMRYDVHSDVFLNHF